MVDEASAVDVYFDSQKALNNIIISSSKEGHGTKDAVAAGLQNWPGKRKKRFVVKVTSRVGGRYSVSFPQGSLPVHSFS